MDFDFDILDPSRFFWQCIAAGRTAAKEQRHAQACDHRHN
jgi:hypothetical protein